MDHQAFVPKNGEFLPKRLPANETPAFTAREQDIMRELIAGATPKEIGYTLNISYNTVLGHQRKLYRKLGINTIRELLSNYSIINGVVTPTAASMTSLSAKTTSLPVFVRWRVFQDNFGSSINVTQNIEYIQERYITTYTIVGKLSSEQNSFTGVTAEPDPATLENMKKMKSLSFTVLGDGNSYKVMITTTDTRVKSGDNHFRKVFTAKKHEISLVNVNLDELAQSPLYGTPVPFNQNNIELFQLQPHSTGEFNLKIWDISFN